MAKVNLKKNGGAIVFIGGMNAMPMMYAIELKKSGFKVLYLVDRPQTDTLSRPENHYSEISYPYPEWVCEFPVRSQMLIPFFRSYFARRINRLVIEKFGEEAQAFFLNGFFISLSPFLSSKSKKIALSHGSDLDSWADLDGANELAESFNRKSIFKYFPVSVAKKLVRAVVIRQFEGFKKSDLAIYFPKGFNKFGDRVLEKLETEGLEVLERYDVSFDPLKGEGQTFKEPNGTFVIFSGVRFTFKTFSEGNADYSKGNDHIINGLGLFHKKYPNIEVHFVEKGPDLEIARQLCSENGLDSVVVWHKEMKFVELLKLYRISDVCFDQVGRHWIGAVGAYGLWLGKPLIANDSLPVLCGIWPEDNPICSAANAEDVCNQLLRLVDDDVRRDVSRKSILFAEKYFSARKVLSELGA